MKVVVFSGSAAWLSLLLFARSIETMAETASHSLQGSSSSNVVGVHYRVGKKIGEGSFGVIFQGQSLVPIQDSCTDERMAQKGLIYSILKLSLLNSSISSLHPLRNFTQPPFTQQEPRKSDAPQLRDEYRTYKILAGSR